jgi:DNA-binding transcriptional regulator YiaG
MATNNNIRSIRQQLGLSQVDLAVAIGVSQGNVSQYETLRQDVPPDVAVRVISAAKNRGVIVTFDDIYAIKKLGDV